MLKYKNLWQNIYSNAMKKGKGKTAKSKYSRTYLINNLLAIYG